MKKIAIILAIAILVCTFASCAQKEQDFTSINDYVAPSTTHKIETGTLSFKDVGGEYAAITDYVGLYEEHSVIIPGMVGDETRGERIVTEICDEAFYYTTSAKSIIIPNTVTTIGNWAFAGCTSLETIVIPASVTSIGKGAFMGCTSLKSVVFEGEAPAPPKRRSSPAGCRTARPKGTDPWRWPPGYRTHHTEPQDPPCRSRS